MSLRVGFIGAGKAAKLHAGAIAAIPDVQVLGVADLDGARGEPLARQFGAKYVREAREILAMPVDAVIIALPHSFLAPMTIEALQAGKHVLVEKQMGISVEEIDKEIAAAREACRVLQPGYVHRFRPECQMAKQLIVAGKIGRPAMVVEDHNMSGDDTVGPWVWKPEINGGGVFFYSGIHGLDRVRWLTGQEVKVAFAQMGRFAHDEGGDDNAAITLRLSGGSVGAVNQNFTPFPIPNRWETTVYGTEGVLRIAHGKLEFANGSGPQPVEIKPQNHFEVQFRDFVGAIREGRAPAVPAEDGRKTMVAMQAIYKSARTNQPVEL